MLKTRDNIILMVLFIICGACQEKIEIPPAPIAPQIEERARTFNQAQGELDPDTLSDLAEWLTSSGGLGTLSLMLISEFFISRLAESPLSK